MRHRKARTLRRETIVSMAADNPSVAHAAIARAAHTRHLVDQLRQLEDRLRAGGGSKRIEKQHKAGKLTARERIAKLIDPGARFLEIGLLIAYDKYDGQAPAAGVVTGIGKIERRPAVVVVPTAPPGTKPRVPSRPPIRPAA